MAGNMDKGPCAMLLAFGRGDAPMSAFESSRSDDGQNPARGWTPQNALKPALASSSSGDESGEDDGTGDTHGNETGDGGRGGAAPMPAFESSRSDDGQNPARGWTPQNALKPAMASSSSGESGEDDGTHGNATGDGGRGGANGDCATSDRTFECVNSREELESHRMGAAAGRRARVARDAGSGWEIKYNRTVQGWGLVFNYNVPWCAPFDPSKGTAETPSCTYSSRGAPLTKVKKAEFRSSDLLLPDMWSGVDPVSSEYAYLPQQRGAASYANDHTVKIRADGTWCVARDVHGRALQPNAVHFWEDGQEGVFRLHLKPGYRAGTWVSVAYGSDYWNDACAEALERKEALEFAANNPAYSGHGACVTWD